jgi:hypothetical protein
MRRFSLAAIGVVALLAYGRTALAQDVAMPTFDIASDCSERPQENTINGNGIELCEQMDRGLRDSLSRRWAGVPAQVKNECIAEVDKPGVGREAEHTSYERLNYCVYEHGGIAKPAATGASGNLPACNPGVSKRQCQKEQVDALFQKLNESMGADGRRAESLAEYTIALRRSIMKQWVYPAGLPKVACTVDIVQSPGGHVISAVADQTCPYDEVGKRSVESAVLRAQPLPYTGFEDLFQKKVYIVVFPEDGMDVARRK